MTEFNLATMFEMGVDAYGDHEYLVVEGKRATYTEMEVRANRLAHHLAEHGVGKDDHVGIYAYNCMEWVETLWAVFKLRAVWININYRYVEDELAYIFDNADLKAMVFAREFAPRIANVHDALPLLNHLVVLEDDSAADLCGLEAIPYEEALASGSPQRDFGPRSGDDLYMLYTGGTTGMPKGVIWRHEDVFFSLGGGIDPLTNEKVSSPEEMIDKASNAEFVPSMMSLAPLMHGASQWSVMGGAFAARKNILVANFDPVSAWQLVEEEKVNGLFVTGDAMARPLVEVLLSDDHTFDTSSLFLMISSAAVLSPSVKDQLLDYFPNLVLADSIGSSESGANGAVMVQKGQTQTKGGGPTVSPVSGTVVLDENLNEMQPGTGVVGKVARKGNIPLGYFKDEQKTAETFVTATNGTRYSVPGDFALLETDGTITLLGRGSVSINSGGEKIYPEEVEGAVKAHADVYDCIVVGVPDEKWGSRVAAVVQPREGTTPELQSIQDQCRKKIAGYKVPRELHVVGQILRAPSGKPDYRWAKQIALGEIEA
ncbi:MAG: acyl-CoA synthetase [Pseudomonadales bacterium]